MNFRISCSTRARGIIAALSLALAAAIPAVAQTTVAYTFDGGGFTTGSTTPLVNAAPDLDPANVNFLATFDAATAGAFAISGTNNTPGSGLSLFELEDTDALSVLLNMPVTSVSLDFAVDGLPNLSLLVLTDGNGVTMDYTGTGDSFTQGSLTYTSATPFTSFTLQGLKQVVQTESAMGQPQAALYQATQIDTDNFVFTVPEPGTGVAVLVAAGVMFGAVRRLTRARVN